MSYKAIVTPIISVRPHPNADRLNLGNASGYQLVISKDVEEGTLGVFFEGGGQLSHEFCYENNLYKHSQLNKDPEKSGFFEDTRRVRTQKFRKANSEGFWIPISSLKWAGDVTKLKNGQLIDTWNGKLICEKYYTKAATARKAQGLGKNKLKKSLQVRFPHFKEHFNTSKLRMNLSNLPAIAQVIITEKCHGTSGRTGYLLEQVSLLTVFRLWWEKFVAWRQKWAIKAFRKLKVRYKVKPAKKTWWTRLINMLEKTTSKSKWGYVTGTRRTILELSETEKGFYSGTEFRSCVHNLLKKAGLQKGETVYYEVVGFSSYKGSKIMPSHNTEKLQDKKLVKRYGKCMDYRYGCRQDELDNFHKILVYRITNTNTDGVVTELPWFQVVTRCKQLGLTHVPELCDTFTLGSTYSAKIQQILYPNTQGELIPKNNGTVLMELCEVLSAGASLLDETHIKEGAVIRLESADGAIRCLKYKSLNFCLMEEILANSDTYIDPEDVS